MRSWLVLMFFLVSGLSYAQEEQLLVGIAGLDIEPPIGIPLAGYGSDKRRLPGKIDWRNKHPHATLFRPSEATHSPIRSKAMVLRKGDSTLVLLSLDMIGLEDAFIKDLAKRLSRHGISEKDILASATHTHEGPGTLSRRLPLEVIAVDFFKKKNYQYVLNKVVSSVEQALQNLEPAELFKTSAIIEGVQRNKFRRKDEEHFDKKASFLVAKSKQDGSWLGGIVNFSIHGGTFPVEILHYSSDINGAIEAQMEDYLNSMNLLNARNTVFLFMNGAEGDVASKGERGIDMIEYHSSLFRSQAEKAFAPENLTPIEPHFSISKHKIYLGIPGSSLRFCVGGMFKKLNPMVKIKLWPLMPAYSYISQAQIGDVTLLSWPGEASTQLGFDLQAIARKLGRQDPWVIGLANDYATYFTTKTEFYEGAYDSCSSLYDYRGGDRILKAHEKHLK